MAAARILCIDDEKEIIDLIRLILGRKGYEVEGAIGGEAGLAKARAWKPDLVLLDLMMPDMDGWEVFHRIRAEEALAKVPVVVVTARAQSIDRVLGLHVARVNDYISKPFTPQDLVESVERVLASQHASRLPPE
ncbi:MAG: response regulator [Anaerolineales bacterium]|nr:response regulator [Anaerolineales bacterium]